MYDYSYGQPWLMGICMYGHQCLPVWLLLWTTLMVICVLMVALTSYLYMYYCICCFLSKNYHQWGYVHTFLILCNGIEGMALQIFHPCLTGVLTSFFSYLTVNLTAHSRNGTEGIGVKFQWQWRDGLNFDGIQGIGLNFDGIEGINSPIIRLQSLYKCYGKPSVCRVSRLLPCANFRKHGKLNFCHVSD